MDTRLTKTDAAALMSFPRLEPAGPHRRQGAAAREAALAVSLASAFAGVGAVMQRIADWPARQRAVAQLQALSDRELEDIGLARGDISRVVKLNMRRGA